MSISLKKIPYESLNSRQQETYNFQKISAVLADFGYLTIRRSDDWNGADFIAQHFETKEFLKVQLRGVCVSTPSTKRKICTFVFAKLGSGICIRMTSCFQRCFPPE